MTSVPAHPLMDSMRWSEVPFGSSEEGPPAIKNHSVVVFQDVLLCFGGYDGRRNRMILTLYSIKKQTWMVPQPPSGETGDVLEPLSHEPNHHHNAAVAAAAAAIRAAARHDEEQQQESENEQDDRVTVSGTPPPGRNGHTATLVVDRDVTVDLNSQQQEEEDTDTAQIIIIGGWLGTGPLAASDLHVLEVTAGGQHLRWYQPPVKGTPPGPCNMHSADFIPKQREIYVFRGGNGREYLNDLHALNVDTFKWRQVQTTGAVPQERANHSSAFLEETGELVIFGGWNGMQRLNDIHILDVATSTWSCPHVRGVLPHPRAGMTLTPLRGRLYLFGGSGTSSKCFDDLQILDRAEMAWLDVVPNGGTSHGTHRSDENYNDYQDASDQQNHLAYYHERHANSNSSSSPFLETASLDWRHRDQARRHMRQGPVYASASPPNPNDEDTHVPAVLLQGRGPGRRAGHTATAVHRKIYFFGGSCGADYLSDFFVLDTDPPPRAMITEPNSLQLLNRHIRDLFNKEEFSDVTFVVEGQRLYGHKMILSIVSEFFRAMFTTGFRESEANAEIEIHDCSYDAFFAMLEYVYSGQRPRLGLDGGGGGEVELHRAVDLLGLADQYFLDHLKQICEQMLQPAVNADTVEYLHQVAQETNAVQLAYICEHYLRNHSASSSGQLSS